MALSVRQDDLQRGRSQHLGRRTCTSKPPGSRAVHSLLVGDKG